MAKRAHDDGDFELTVDHLETIDRHVTNSLRADISGVAKQVTDLQSSSRREFDMVHGRVKGVGDTVAALDNRINGRISKSEKAIELLLKSVTTLEAEAEANDAELPARRFAAAAALAEQTPYLTRAEIGRYAKTITFFVAGLVGLIEFLIRLAPYIAKAMTP